MGRRPGTRKPPPTSESSAEISDLHRTRIEYWAAILDVEPADAQHWIMDLGLAIAPAYRELEIKLKGVAFNKRSSVVEALAEQADTGLRIALEDANFLEEVRNLAKEYRRPPAAVFLALARLGLETERRMIAAERSQKTA